ncbi:MAG: carboxypeptidase-like regulatory domain-containing protein [Byssovorax sp.]
MKPLSTAGSPLPDADPPARMSRAQLGLALAVAFTLFLLEAGPVWRHPWDMELLNRAIFWSYVAIPLLVIGTLAWSKRLSVRAFVIDALTLTLLKYACTFAFSLVLWEITPFPAPVHQAASPQGARTLAVESAPAATPIDPAKTGTLTGTATDAAGHPIAGALVWISGGLEDYVFAVPSAPVRIARAGSTEIPPVAVVQVNQPILARSADGKLHTLVAVKDGRTLFNTPLLPSGEPSHVGFREAEGLVTLHCNVHPGAAEAEGQILVLGHPFFTRTDEQGRFELHGVPAGRMKIATAGSGRPAAEQAVELEPGGATTVTLTLPAPTAAGEAARAGLRDE